MNVLENIKFKYRALRYRYKLDPIEVQYLERKIKPGETVVDIGAHKGGYLYWLHKAVGQSGRVYAFEPQPNLYAYLQTICADKAYANVQLEHAGISDQSGQLDFFIPKSSGASSPGATFNSHKKEAEVCEIITVKTLTLDQYFTDKQPPSFLKIDVEGHELNVFKGAENLLKNTKPTILVECEQRHLQYPIDQVFNYLLEFGYTGFFVQQQQIQALSKFSLEQHQRADTADFWKAPNYCNNFIFE